MSWTLVAHTTNGNGADTTGANFLVGAFAGSAYSVPTDNKGNTWVRLSEQQGLGGGHYYLAYCVNPTVGSGHVVSATGDAAVRAWAAFDGGDTTSPFDVESAGAALQAMPAQGGSVTPSQNDSLIIAGIGDFPDATVLGINGGFTITDFVQAVGGPSYGVALAYLIQSGAPASANPTWSYESGGSQTVCLSNAVFKPAAGGEDPGDGSALLARVLQQLTAGAGLNL